MHSGEEFLNYLYYYVSVNLLSKNVDSTHTHSSENAYFLNIGYEDVNIHIFSGGEQPLRLKLLYKNIPIMIMMYIWETLR